MGAVYHALDENLNIDVAVKENLFLSDEYARQFQREANILASLRHPNLPRVGDYFIIPGQGQYLIMDYIEGEDLRDRIERSGPLTEREAALVGAAICDALTYLHTRRPQVIHRDIKPGNIKITPEGEVVLVDFGLAKVVMGSQQTQSGARAMTPGYSPPEQYGTTPTDPRSDIYSLGATLYAALSGTIPEDALARATGKAKLTSLKILNPRINRKLAAVIEQALELEPENRFESAEEMKKALLAAVSLSRDPDEKIFITPPPGEKPGLGVSYSSQPIPDKPSEPRPASSPLQVVRERRVLLPAAGVIVLVALVTILYMAGRSGLLPSLAASGATQPVETQAAAAVTDTVEAVAMVSAEPSPTGTPTLHPTVTPTLAETETEVVETTPSVTPQPGALPTPFGGGESQIAFTSNRSGTMQIWIMNADGSNQVQLTHMTDGACLPAWSPDGELLAFISPCASKREIYEGAQIYVWDLNPRTEPEPLPLPASPAGDFYPVWSPDGTQIVFTTLRGTNSQIMAYNLADETLTQLTDGRYADLQASFSPDGTQIAFIRKFQFNQIWLMGRRGEFQAQFSPDVEVNHHWPVWTPDGAFLFASQSSTSPSIPWLVAYKIEDREVVETRRIPGRGHPDIAPVAYPSISPDGAWIAFESWPEGTNHDIYLAGINGANRKRLTTDESFDFAPAWRP